LINHGWGLVVSGRAVLGANVTLMHGATIGQADRISRTGDRESRFPSVGDNVWIGPHAVVAGARVGSGARVLGGAMVTEDVPPAAMVGGNPGSLLRRDVVPDVVNPVPR
jgi:serine O-acetyltransferase